MLDKKYKVIAMEMQAHGRTADRDAPESFEQDADDVFSLLKQLGISKADFLGFSNGGTTAVEIAIRHPELVNKMILGMHGEYIEEIMTLNAGSKEAAFVIPMLEDFLDK